MFEMQLRSASVRAGPRLPGEIRAQAIGRAEAGTFADEHHHHARSQQLADIVTDCDAALFNNRDRRDPAVQIAQQEIEQRHGMAMDRQRGKAVRDHEGGVIFVLPTSAVNRFRESSLKRRPRSGRRRYSSRSRAKLAKVIDGRFFCFNSSSQRIDRQRQMDRIARLGMRQLKFEQCPCGKANARAAQFHASGGVSREAASVSSMARLRISGVIELSDTH